MDSEHRHELEENDLDKWLAEKLKMIQAIWPQLVTGLVALLVAAGGWAYYSSQAEAQRADSWRTFTLAVEGVRPSLEALQQAADENPGSEVETWSRITWADGRLWQGANIFMRNRSDSDKALTEAEDTYKTLLSARNSEIADRAAYGLARIYEMRGDLEAAREQYGRVGGPFAEIAAARAEELATDKTVASYAWITQTAATPSRGASGERPDLTPDAIALPGESDETADPDATLDSLLEDIAADAEEATEETTEEAAPVEE